MFVILQIILNYLDGTAACDINLKFLMKRLEHDTKLATKWFGNSLENLNEVKYHLQVAGHR